MTNKPITGLVKTEPTSEHIARFETEFGNERTKLLRDTLCKDLTLEEMALFLEVATAKKLDPFSRQIHAMKRRAKTRKYNPQTRKQEDVWEEKLSIVTGIDGFRTLAERTGKYRGQLGPFWCGEDGVWKDVWLAKAKPAACRIGVLREDFKEPLWSVALWDEYAQGGQGDDGSRYYTSVWRDKPTVMIAKCAEAIGLRRAFPEEISGLYTTDEMKAEEAMDDLRARSAELDARLAAATPVVALTPPAAAAARALAPATQKPEVVPAQAVPAPAAVAPPAEPPSDPAMDAYVAAGGPASTQVIIDKIWGPSETAAAPPPEAYEPQMTSETKSPPPPARAPDEVSPPKPAAEPAKKPKPKSATSLLIDFKRAVDHAGNVATVRTVIDDWDTQLSHLPARAQVMARSYAAVVTADRGGPQASAEDGKAATQLNDLAKE